MSLILAALLGTALAQDEVLPRLDAWRWDPALDAGIFVRTDEPDVQPGPVLRVGATWTREPWVERQPDGGRLRLARDVAGLDAVAGFAVGPARLAVQVPLLEVTSDVASTSYGLGDVAADAKLRLVAARPVGLAVAGRLLLPTATVDGPVSSGTLAWEASAVAGLAANGTHAAVNLGFHHHPVVAIDAGTTLGSWAALGAGIGREVGPNGSLSAEVTAALPVAGGGAGLMPVEVTLGGTRRLSQRLVLRGGLGFGLTTAVGAPLLRLSIALAGDRGPRRGVDPSDPDGDGVIADRCPGLPEDRDGDRDGDGCPDGDRDGDGLDDAVDPCADVAEDFDGFEDGDGCPEADTWVRVRFVGDDGRAVPGTVSWIRGGDGGFEGDGLVEAPLASGSYTVQALAPGYHDLVARLEVVGGKPVDHVFTLKRLEGPLGTLVLRVNDPDGHAVSGSFRIDDGPGRWTTGVTDIPLPAGPHDLQVSAPGFLTRDLELEVSADVRFTVLVVMEPEPPR